MIEVKSDVLRAQLEKDVNEDIDSFQVFCRDVLKHEQPLEPSERAIIKTYLGYKLKVMDEPTGTTAGVEASHGA